VTLAAEAGVPLAEIGDLLDAGPDRFAIAVVNEPFPLGVRQRG
jgi:hypothetical protein